MNEKEIICTAVLESLKQIVANNKKIADILEGVTNMNVPDEMLKEIADTIETHRPKEEDFYEYIETVEQAVEICKSAGMW